jgi:2-oxoglutarate ferredoxin oxidoreductase subunit delta
MIKIEINQVLCKKCGICAFVCPRQVYQFNELEGPLISKPDDCIFCDMCIMMCPDMAINISKIMTEEKPRNDMS